MCKRSDHHNLIRKPPNLCRLSITDSMPLTLSKVSLNFDQNNTCVIQEGTMLAPIMNTCATHVMKVGSDKIKYMRTRKDLTYLL